MHKHRKWILWAMVILIVPAFVVWGGYRRSNRKDNQPKNATGVVARVGEATVTTQQFRAGLDAEANRIAQYMERPTYRQLLENGTAQRVMDQLVDTALFTNLVAQRDFPCDRDFLIERMKESFKTEDGQFNAWEWNNFVEQSQGRDWNATYARYNEDVTRSVVFETIRASGRVLEPEDRRGVQREQQYVEVEVREDRGADNAV